MGRSIHLLDLRCLLGSWIRNDDIPYRRGIGMSNRNDWDPYRMGLDDSWVRRLNQSVVETEWSE